MNVENFRCVSFLGLAFDIWSDTSVAFKFHVCELKTEWAKSNMIMVKRTKKKIEIRNER